MGLLNSQKFRKDLPYEFITFMWPFDYPVGCRTGKVHAVRPGRRQKRVCPRYKTHSYSGKNTHFLWSLVNIHVHLCMIKLHIIYWLKDCILQLHGCIFYVWSVQFLNDLENDKKYKNWPNSVQDILRPTFPGMLRHVAKNIFHLVSVTLVWISMYTVLHHAFSRLTLVKVCMVPSISLCSVLYTYMFPRDYSYNCARTLLSHVYFSKEVFSTEVGKTFGSGQFKYFIFWKNM